MGGWKIFLASAGSVIRNALGKVILGPYHSGTHD